MASEGGLKIFISWSGELAGKVADVLRQWLPRMFDNIDPWASLVDIEAGARGLDAIQDRLNQSAFGIIVVTTENMSKPWLNFEAGALSKSLNVDSNRVVPLLVNFEHVYQLQGPINQFQAMKLDQDGMGRICKAIASVIGLDTAAINRRFEWAWPDLQQEIKAAKENVGDQPPPPDIDEKDLLSSMFKSIRALEMQIANLSTNTTMQNARYVAGVASTGSEYVNPWKTPPGKRGRDPWTDPKYMQEIILEVRRIAESFAPVRDVGTAKWRGEPVIGVVFESDNDNGEIFNKFHAAMRHLPVTVAILLHSDAGLMDE